MENTKGTKTEATKIESVYSGKKSFYHDPKKVIFQYQLPSPQLIDPKISNYLVACNKKSAFRKTKRKARTPLATIPRMSKKALPQYIGHVIRGKPMVSESLDDFRPEAQNEFRFCQAGGKKSVLSVPMVSEGKVMGACALVSVRAERRWKT